MWKWFIRFDVPPYESCHLIFVKYIKERNERRERVETHKGHLLYIPSLSLKYIEFYNKEMNDR